MNASTFVLSTYGSEIRVRPDRKGCVVSVDYPITLSPDQMRTVAFELLAVARDRDGKDWVEELDRMRVSRL